MIDARIATRKILCSIGVVTSVFFAYCNAQEVNNSIDKTSVVTTDFDLSKAIADAEEGSIVRIPIGIHSLKSPLVVNKNLTIESEKGAESDARAVIKCDRTNCLKLAAENICLKNLRVFMQHIDVYPQEDEPEEEFPAFCDEPSSENDEDALRDCSAGVFIISGNVAVENCSFDGETRKTNSRYVNQDIGIRVLGENSHLTMANSQVTCLDTGVLITDGSDGQFTECVFKYNGNAFGVVNESSIDCDKINVSLNYNGALLVNHSKCNVNNSSFSRNMNMSFFIYSYAESLKGNSVIENSTFKLSGRGLGVSGGTCAIKNSVFSDHYEKAILSLRASLNVNNCKFLKNQFAFDVHAETRLVLNKCVIDEGQFGIDSLHAEIMASDSEFRNLGKAIKVVESKFEEKNNLFNNNVSNVEIIE